MSSQCTLKIKAGDLRIDLRGDADFVRAGYAALRTELLSRLQALPVTSDLPAVTEPAEPGPPVTLVDPEQDYVWVYRCNELYNKVYVLRRDDLVAHGIGRCLDFDRVRRLYLDARDAEALEALIPHGKTLWSELTRLGQQRLRTS